ncbi:hypothetical protein [Caulobacter mirabilis]|uniref:Uncharacterized protein n=1 Tax=Caulobacter mirabilis TaxID=69666 RepID=A0A2D2ATW8_9CAUL|nr:hypothetical protein [Caulobacter mirabilis]ATQ41450.1 hypothetical protein CSW64_02970 [Caulobacter mirabilis]
MINRLRFLNPLLPLPTDAEQRSAARAAAVGAFLASGQIVVGIVASRLMETPAAAAMAPLTPSMLVVAAILLLAGAIQWRKPTRLIPALLIVLALAGLATTITAHFILPAEFKAAYDAPSGQLLAQRVFNRIASAAELLLFITGLRGAILLRRNARSEAASALA